MSELIEDLLFFKLKDLILEQSEGEWDDAMIIRDAHHFANNLRPLFAAEIERLTAEVSGLRSFKDEIAANTFKEPAR